MLGPCNKGMGNIKSLVHSFSMHLNVKQFSSVIQQDLSWDDDFCTLARLAKDPMYVGRLHPYITYHYASPWGWNTKIESEPWNIKIQLLPIMSFSSFTYILTSNKIQQNIIQIVILLRGSRCFLKKKNTSPLQSLRGHYITNPNNALGNPWKLP